MVRKLNMLVKIENVLEVSTLDNRKTPLDGVLSACAIVTDVPQIMVVILSTAEFPCHRAFTPSQLANPLENISQQPSGTRHTTQ